MIVRVETTYGCFWHWNWPFEQKAPCCAQKYTVRGTNSALLTLTVYLFLLVSSPTLPPSTFHPGQWHFHSGRRSDCNPSLFTLNGHVLTHICILMTIVHFSPWMVTFSLIICVEVSFEYRSPESCDGLFAGALAGGGAHFWMARAKKKPRLKNKRTRKNTALFTLDGYIFTHLLHRSH